MMLKHSIPIILTLTILTASLFIFYKQSFNTMVSNDDSSRIILNVNVYDYFSNEPIRGLKFQLNVTAKTGERFSVLMFSGEDGMAKADLTRNASATSEFFASYISLHGIWVLEKVVSEREYSIITNKWSIAKPEKLSTNGTWQLKA